MEILHASTTAGPVNNDSDAAAFSWIERPPVWNVLMSASLMRTIGDVIKAIRKAFVIRNANEKSIISAFFARLLSFFLRLLTSGGLMIKIPETSGKQTRKSQQNTTHRHICIPMENTSKYIPMCGQFLRTIDIMLKRITIIPCITHAKTMVSRFWKIPAPMTTICWFSSGVIIQAGKLGGGICAQSGDTTLHSISSFFLKYSR